MGYDVIGDIHGQFQKLESLLARLGYRQRQGAWRHPERSAIFVGDFIDRGRQGVETVQTVRAMVDAGSAQAVMGNHELNAIAWHTPDPRDPGEFLRPRLREPWGAKNRRQHKDFLAQVEHDPDLHAELVGWFLSLPLWLDLDGLRVVHACWHAPFIDWLSPQLREGRLLTPELLIEATTEPEDPAEKDTAAPSIFKAVEALTKGLEIPLPAPSGSRCRTCRRPITSVSALRVPSPPSSVTTGCKESPACSPRPRPASTTAPARAGHWWPTAGTRAPLWMLPTS
jgi:hypothetical protein